VLNLVSNGSFWTLFTKDRALEKILLSTSRKRNTLLKCAPKQQ